MIKSLLIPFFLFCVCATGISQTSQVDYLEVTTNYIEGSNDSSQQVVTYVISIKDYDTSDSLTLSLIKADGQSVYQESGTLNNWISNYPHRTVGTTLYLTIEAGTYAGVGQFEAKAYTIVGGNQLPGKTFSKGEL